MPTTAAGYRSIRNHLASTWRWFALYDQLGLEVTRVDIWTDPRCTVAINAATGRISIYLNATSSDADIGNPRTIAAGALWNSQVGGKKMVEGTIEPMVVFDAPDDTTPFIWTIGVPEVMTLG